MAGAGELQQLQREMELEAKLAVTKIGGKERFLEAESKILAMCTAYQEIDAGRACAPGKKAAVKMQVLISVKKKGEEIQVWPAECDNESGI